jgi:LemA protein
MNVQTELAGTENRINVARTDYSSAVQDYNTTRNSFPAVLTAGLLGFKEEPYFQADPSAQQAPNIGSANDLRRTQPAANAPAAPAPPANAPAANSNK